ncbi:MAG TPA: succinate dehydrogenase cytochrome b subunit [Bacteroidales bacterium]|nr:succinate dehydrogenase cytochrome b subunit [Bacteroidales bacterium]
MSRTLTSSIGKKVIMSLAGLFLVVFLVVHLSINLSLILADSRETFNKAAHFMGNNIVVRVLEIILFGGFLLHITYGLILQVQNWMARGPVRYRRENFSNTSFFSKFMIHTAVIISVFLVIHLFDFYLKAKLFGEVPSVIYDGKDYHDLGILVIEKFKIGWVVVFYLGCFVILAFHLLHGFQSAFQTLGLNHRVYSPVIKALGIIYTVVIVGGFMSIPIYIYFRM